MSYQYTNPYNQNTSGYGQTDMNRVQGNAGYMSSQMSQPMSQMQTSPRMMQTSAPTGTTPLARQMPPMTEPGTPSIPPMPSTPNIPQRIPLTSLAGALPPTSSMMPSAGSMPRPSSGTETPVTVASPYYTAGFLRNFIGKNVRVEFTFGTSGSLTDRYGTLLEVGASYIVLQPLLTDELQMADLYSIRFVTIFG